MKRKKDRWSFFYRLTPILFILFLSLFSQIVRSSYLNYSIDIISFILLLQNKFSALFYLFILFLFVYSITQEKVQFNFNFPENFAIYSAKALKSKKDNYLSIYSQGKTKINRQTIQSLIKDIPRHGYLNYTNKNSLTKEYFSFSRQSIENENSLFLILSKTGSPASEVLSIFTHKEYNHISLSFDRSLYTMVSYNGGNHYQQPGLNSESLASLNQKAESRLLVYSLKVDKEDRLKILKKIEQINKEGSAYNVLGLLTNVSVRSNMMYCSQFVYFMLENIDFNYFQAPHHKIKPTDFIECDQTQQLTFEYKIDFSLTNEQKIN